MESIDQRKKESICLSTLSWQRDTDLAVRENMLCSIMELITTKLERYVDVSKWDYIARYAQHIEVKVYANAGSLAEYANEKTLLARYFYISSSLLRNMQSEKKKKFLSSSALTLKKRKSYPETLIVNIPSKKKPKMIDSLFFLQNYQDIICHVYSFMSTQDIITQTRISSFSARLLPHCVTCFSIDAIAFLKKQNDLCVDLSEHLVRRYRSLRKLQIFHPATVPKKPLPTDRKLRANGITHISMHITNCCEGIIRQFARALARYSAPKLEVLELSSVFFNTETINSIGEITYALKEGCCPSLQELYVGGNSISDSGASMIANLVLSGACPNLRVLDLRRNSIGETGIRALAYAILSSKISFRLEKLLLGGNILCDSAAPYIADILRSSSSNNLQSLSLDFNFFGSEGVGIIAKALQESNCRQLRFLDFAGNSTNDGAVQIAKLLRQNSCPMLTSVDVGNITEAGAQAIEEALCLRSKNRNSL